MRDRGEGDRIVRGGGSEVAERVIEQPSPLERPHQKSIMVQIENAGEHFLQKGALFRRRLGFV